MVYLTRRERFNAAHKLYNPQWTDEQNKVVFGKCSNTNWHGHNYHLYITVKGVPAPETGFVMNVKDLSKIIKEYAVNKLDHCNLNLDVDFMQGILPTTENLAKAIWHQIAKPIRNKGCVLHCVKLYETENIYVEYYGD